MVIRGRLDAVRAGPRDRRPRQGPATAHGLPKARNDAQITSRRQAQWDGLGCLAAPPRREQGEVIHRQSEAGGLRADPVQRTGRGRAWIGEKGGAAVGGVLVGGEWLKARTRAEGGPAKLCSHGRWYGVHAGMVARSASFVAPGWQQPSRQPASLSDRVARQRGCLAPPARTLELKIDVLLCLPFGGCGTPHTPPTPRRGPTQASRPTPAAAGSRHVVAAKPARPYDDGWCSSLRAAAARRAAAGRANGPSP
ncbi:hypothetical protein BDY21DRAFT_361801 [Lineolata rhizophorae]|uniref:Uncharacterized protein n=1 Tax=Lineolata rhizophorae TaxID=578093 RepID=A0A6A6P7V6_9PEZI|nr:hypothetical protein BDY21DRAFT_361801 [Lineolata rhizophorae]